MRFNNRVLVAFFGLSFTAYAGVANADVDNHVITLSANVPTSCSITGTPTIVNGPFSDVSTTASKFKVNVSGTTANPTTGVLTLGNVNCSSSNINVTMTPNGWIKHTNTSVSNKITYTAKIIDNGTKIETSVISDANGTNPRTVVISASQSVVGIEIATNQATSLPPGQYFGTLTISINPS
jgi:hypothetical protein